MIRYCKKKQKAKKASSKLAARNYKYKYFNSRVCEKRACLELLEYLGGTRKVSCDTMQLMNEVESPV